jgi:hypothetical protein
MLGSRKLMLIIFKNGENNIGYVVPHMCFPHLPPSVEVSYPKTINITQYLNKQFLIKSSQTTQLYTTKVFYKQFSCHHHIKNNQILNSSNDTWGMSSKMKKIKYRIRVGVRF